MTAECYPVSNASNNIFNNLRCTTMVSFLFSVLDLQLLLDTEKAEKQMLAEQLSAVEVSAHDL